MKTPTLDEVKEYFKDAKFVQENCYGKEKFKVDVNKIKLSSFGNYVQGVKNFYLWSPRAGYAKILSYKEPKEETFKITREQLEQLHRQGNDYTKFDIEYLFPEVVETKLEVGKWYKYPNYEKWNLRITEVDSKAKRVKGYGFGSDGVWMENALNDSWEFKELEKCIEMTEQEVTEALTKEAVRIGFKEGVYFKTPENGYSGICSDSFKYNREYNILYCGSNAIFNKGKWAEIVPTLTRQEAEAKLNCKII